MENKLDMPIVAIGSESDGIIRVPESMMKDLQMVITNKYFTISNGNRKIEGKIIHKRQLDGFRFKITVLDGEDDAISVGLTFGNNHMIELFKAEAESQNKTINENMFLVIASLLDSDFQSFFGKAESSDQINEFINNFNL